LTQIFGKVVHLDTIYVKSRYTLPVFTGSLVVSTRPVNTAVISDSRIEGPYVFMGDAFDARERGPEDGPWSWSVNTGSVYRP